MQIAELQDVDERRFREDVVAQYRPVVLRGAVRDWPAVRHGLASADSFFRYLMSFDNGGEVDTLRMPPSARGRIFYNETLDGFNYDRSRATISAVIGQIAKHAKFENPPGVVAQSALIAECLPRFADENRLALVPAHVQPRIWFGNSVVTPAHFDESSNIACVVAGRRRFTLLPPEQIANLYLGPLGYAPTGTPISLVSFREPDLARFPRFREAQEAAQVAELEPGDAIYIPPLWWHHVESLAKANALVNYWWRDEAVKRGSALDSLLHAVLDLRQLPPEQKQAWRAIFDHYVFGEAGAAASHIPERRRGVLGEMTPELARQVRAFLVAQLQRAETKAGK